MERKRTTEVRLDGPPLSQKPSEDQKRQISEQLAKTQDRHPRLTGIGVVFAGTRITLYLTIAAVGGPAAGIISAVVSEISIRLMLKGMGY